MAEGGTVATPYPQAMPSSLHLFPGFKPLENQKMDIMGRHTFTIENQGEGSAHSSSQVARESEQNQTALSVLSTGC